MLRPKFRNEGATWRPARTISCIAICFAAIATNAAQLYRWVDKDGRVYYGDAVPDSQQGKARAVDLTNARFSDAERQAALARASREKETPGKPTAPEFTPAKPAAAPAATRPAGPVADSSDFPSGRKACQEAWRQYNDSVACFAPYVQVNGSVKAEAFQKCQVLKMPALCN